jgi:hypothetical protein
MGFIRPEGPIVGPGPALNCTAGPPGPNGFAPRPVLLTASSGSASLAPPVELPSSDWKVNARAEEPPVATAAIAITAAAKRSCVKPSMMIPLTLIPAESKHAGYGCAAPRVNPRQRAVVGYF